MKKVKLRAHAKLNLSLEVVGRRSNGYHNIVSLMQGIGLNDIICMEKCAENGTKYNLPHCTIRGHVVYLCTDEKTIPSDMNNLALKGIAAVIESTDDIFDGDLLVNIDKKLPVAAGIAGGSGNAAAAMLGMNAMLDMPLSLRKLMEIGEGVGADVPFSIFMNAYRNRKGLSSLKGIEEAGDAAWISGIGENVERCAPVRRYVVMANPGISVPTADAYRAIDEMTYGDASSGGNRILFKNDLEKYTLAEYSEAALLKQIMEEKLSADELLMSGSGPTIAAYYKDRNAALRDAELMKRIASSQSGWRSWFTSTGD